VQGNNKRIDQLEHISRHDKTLLSYHVHRAKNSKALADLGLVVVEKVERGKITAKLTNLGKLLPISKTTDDYKEESLEPLHGMFIHGANHLPLCFKASSLEKF
jgi:hypothetical protein